jgi:hypothetical protein
LKPYTGGTLGEYQKGFRGRQINNGKCICNRTILEKLYEYNITLNQLFIDFTKACVAVNKKEFLA